MYNTGFPVLNLDVKDSSGASTGVLFSAPEGGLCVPFGFIFAERGTPGSMYFGGANELVPLLGAATFDPSSPYFNPATQFIASAMANAGVEVIVLRDPLATTARLGLFLEVTNKNVTQYQKASDGTRLVDAGGNWLPVLDGQNNPVTAPGVKLKWTVRALTTDEMASGLTKTSTTNGATTTDVYPIMSIRMLSSGLYGNRQGFSIYSTRGDNTQVANAIQSVLYRFVPMELPTAVSTTTAPISDVFGANGVDVSFKKNAIYNKTGFNYSFDSVLNNNYSDPDSGALVLPYKVYTYGDNIGIVGNRVLSVSPNLSGYDPYNIDLMSGQDSNGIYYDYVEVDALSTGVVNSVVVNYAQGGSDGDTSFTKLQALMRDWLSGSNRGEFSNVTQHPITHYSDPGLTMDTKYLLLNMLGMRDDIVIDLSTQDALLPPNTKAQDISAAQALLTRAQMHPESTMNGVGCMRVSIWAHTGNLVSGGAYSGKVPLTLHRMVQRASLDGGQAVLGSAGGRPNSDITLFRQDINWVADDDTVRRLSWASCLNVAMHATRTQLFYPSMRTVYPNDTSLASDVEIADRYVYIKKIARRVWAKYAGVRLPSKKLYPLIQADIENDCNAAFGQDDIRVTATIFQTAGDENLGYAISANIQLASAMPFRQGNFNVELTRLPASATA